MTYEQQAPPEKLNGTYCPLCANPFNKLKATEDYFLKCNRGHLFAKPNHTDSPYTYFNERDEVLIIKHWPEFPNSAYRDMAITLESILCWQKCISDAGKLPYSNRGTVQALKNELYSFSLISKQTPQLIASLIRTIRNYDKALLKNNPIYVKKDSLSKSDIEQLFESYAVELYNLKNAVLYNLKRNKKSLEDIVPFLKLPLK